jgi:hypothetical protein
LHVSLADKTHNARAILTDYRQLGDDLWSRINGGKEGTFWYYRALAVVYREALPCTLASELEMTVEAFSGTER